MFSKYVLVGALSLFSGTVWAETRTVDQPDTHPIMVQGGQGSPVVVWISNDTARPYTLTGSDNRRAPHMVELRFGQGSTFQMRTGE